MADFKISDKQSDNLYLITVNPTESNSNLVWSLYDRPSTNPFTGVNFAKPTTEITTNLLSNVYEHFFNSSNIVKTFGDFDLFWSAFLFLLVKNCSDSWMNHILHQLSDDADEGLISVIIDNPAINAYTLAKIASSYPVEKIRLKASLKHQKLTSQLKSEKKETKIVKFDPDNLDSIQFLDWVDKASIEELENFSITSKEVSLFETIIQFIKRIFK